ncbi:DUF3613 domain-containing protein [Paraburkholderia sp. A1RI-2L]|uniref:DUF3613 domain-containing protein n=1 Tax=Paraburkholderia sp. A1RI-2L TaxID=3028367 RepID=UPI003B77B148
MKTNQLIDAGVAASLAASAVFRACHHRAAMAVLVASMKIALVLVAPAAHAEGMDAQTDAQTTGEPVPNSEIGHSTRAWLDLQRSNAQAAPALPMLGEEAGYAWRRYMKSFDTDIPTSFGSTVQTGNGQGGGVGGATMGGGGAY